MTIKCNQGLNFNENGKHSQKFKDCGLTDRYQPGLFWGCDFPINSKRCAMTDIWLNGIEDKALTMYNCGGRKEPSEEEEGKCTPVCEKENFKMYKEDIELYLEKLSIEITDECLKMLTNIDAVAWGGCAKHDNCNDGHCEASKILPGSEECKSLTTPYETNNTASVSFESTSIVTKISNANTETRRQPNNTATSRTEATNHLDYSDNTPSKPNEPVNNDHNTNNNININNNNINSDKNPTSGGTRKFDPINVKLFLRICIIISFAA